RLSVADGGRVFFLGFLVAFLGSCGGSSGSNNTGTPGIGSPAAPAQVNVYLGTAGVQTPPPGIVTPPTYAGGVWTVTLNNAEGQFSYRTASNFTPTGTLPIQGTMVRSSGFLALTQTNQNGPTQPPAGYAL